MADPIIFTIIGSNLLNGKKNKTVLFLFPFFYILNAHLRLDALLREHSALSVCAKERISAHTNTICKWYVGASVNMRGCVSHSE